MAIFENSLFEPFEIQGAFSIEESTVGGIFTAEPNKLFSLRTATFSKEAVLKDTPWGKYKTIPIIHAVPTGLRPVTLVETNVQRIQGSGGIAITGISDYIISGGHFDQDKLFEGVVVSFNIWPEFCYAQGFAMLAGSKDDLVTNIREAFSIACCDSTKRQLGYDGDFFDQIHFSDPVKETLQKEIAAVFEKVKKEQNTDHIEIWHKSQHDWFVRFERATGMEDLSAMEMDVRSFADLLLILTYCRTSAVACDLYTKRRDSSGHNYSPLLFPVPITKDDLKHSEKFVHQLAPITLPKLVNEWPEVLKAWYDKTDILYPYVNILRSNQSEEINDFKYTRCIDALSMIGSELGFSKERKYQDVVNALGFDELHKYLMKIYGATTDKELGKSISASRAFVVHNEKAGGQSDWDSVRKCAHIVECMELLILSHIHHQIGVPDNLREAFQNHWLNKKQGIKYINDLKDSSNGD